MNSNNPLNCTVFHWSITFFVSAIETIVFLIPKYEVIEIMCNQVILGNKPKGILENLLKKSVKNSKLKNKLTN